jgi:hypothetical protein
LVYDEESRLVKFCKGLHPKIRLVVSMAKPKDYQKALDLALIAKRNIQVIEETEIKSRFKGKPSLSWNEKRENHG